MTPTPWFPSDVTPVHVGYYEVRYSGDVGSHDFLFWNGDRWQYTRTTDGPPLWGHSGDEFWRGLSGRHA